MQRRRFIPLFGSAVGGAHVAIGDAGGRFINAASAQSYTWQLAAFLKRPSETGYVDG
jgi:hypothetical protein